MKWIAGIESLHMFFIYEYGCHLLFCITNRSTLNVFQLQYGCHLNQKELGQVWKTFSELILQVCCHLDAKQYLTIVMELSTDFVHSPSMIGLGNMIYMKTLVLSALTHRLLVWLWRLQAQIGVCSCLLEVCRASKGGSYLYWTRPCTRRAGHNHRPGIPGNKEHGGLRHLGRFFKNKEEGGCI